MLKDQTPNKTGLGHGAVCLAWDVTACDQHTGRFEVYCIICNSCAEMREVMVASGTPSMMHSWWSKMPPVHLGAGT